jgi:hypothetical protein
MLSQARTVGLLLAVATGAMSGCVARVHGHARTSTVVEAEPSLVLVDGVWVVEDYDEPVFYDEGYYWRFYGGVWYRSNVHHGNWVRIDVVPVRVRAIDRPTRFVRFRAAANAQKRRGPPPRGDRPDRGGPPDHAPAHGVRGDQPGHDASKADMKEDKAEAKEDKAEAKADAKADKADAKADKADAKADAKAAKEAEKAAKEAEKAAAKEAKEKAKADAKAAKEAEKAAAKEAKEKAKEEKGGGGGGKKGGKKDQP